jgi:hypothetical protein
MAISIAARSDLVAGYPQTCLPWAGKTAASRSPRLPSPRMCRTPLKKLGCKRAAVAPSECCF